MPDFLLHLTVLLFFSSAAIAQLSPGDLAREHAELEGLRNCTKCHELGKPIDGERCLECHSLLKGRIEQDLGYHASAAVKTESCVSCHSDHHGLDFRMIEWEGGRDAFDHADSGWPLEGAHAQVACRECHRHDFWQEGLINRHEASLGDSTFLAMDASCISCHRDEHAGQFSESCDTCHGMEAWTPLPDFDHNNTAYPLDGAHLEVECEACHTRQLTHLPRSRAAVEDASEDKARRYREMNFEDCASCHDSKHRANLGPRCDECHLVDAFASMKSPFNHGLSGYELDGRHSEVSCAECHAGEGWQRFFPFDLAEGCIACHEDVHEAQFMTGEPLLACESCHTTATFKPSLYTLDRHAREAAPLEGAHLATACEDCHVTDAEVVAWRWLRGGFETDGCVDCHASPHRTEDGLAASSTDCMACHRLIDWSCPDFDHDGTEFPLKGAHASISCRDCHNAEADVDVIPLKLAERACLDCHGSPHRDQFLEDEMARACTECHGENSWQELHYDHNESRFPLDGEHDQLACIACHLKELDTEGSFVRYKPLGIQCVDCHGK